MAEVNGWKMPFNLSETRAARPVEKSLLSLLTTKRPTALIEAATCSGILSSLKRVLAKEVAEITSSAVSRAHCSRSDLTSLMCLAEGVGSASVAELVVGVSELQTPRLLDLVCSLVADSGIVVRWQLGRVKEGLVGIGDRVRVSSR